MGNNETRVQGNYQYSSRDFNQDSPPRSSPPPRRTDGSPGNKRTYQASSAFSIENVKIDRGHELGEGSFARVYKGVNIVDGSEYAVKVIDKVAVGKEMLDLIKQEAGIVFSLDNPNIIKIYQTTENEDYIMIYMDLFTEGDVHTYMSRFDYVNECTSYRIFSQMINGLDYIFSRHIVHRDIKLENALIDSKNLRVVLIDFGFATHEEPGTLLKDHPGSVAYASPELLGNNDYDGYAADIWAMGVALFVLTTGGYPFESGDNTRETVRQIRFAEPTYPGHLSAELVELLKGMLRKSAATRYDIQDVMNSSWMKKWQGYLTEEESCPPATPKRQNQGAQVSPWGPTSGNMSPIVIVPGDQSPTRMASMGSPPPLPLNSPPPIPLSPPYSLSNTPSIPSGPLGKQEASWTEIPIMPSPPPMTLPSRSPGVYTPTKTMQDWMFSPPASPAMPIIPPGTPTAKGVQDWMLSPPPSPAIPQIPLPSRSPGVYIPTMSPPASPYSLYSSPPQPIIPINPVGYYPPTSSVISQSAESGITPRTPKIPVIPYGSQGLSGLKRLKGSPSYDNLTDYLKTSEGSPTGQPQYFGSPKAYDHLTAFKELEH